MRRPISVEFVKECVVCGKRCYRSKRAAVQAARSIEVKTTMTPFRCGHYWHIGHSSRIRSEA